MELLERDLRELGRSRAPRGFTGRVLAAVGLGDAYASVETVIGPFFVAWNQAGNGVRVSAVRQASDGAPRFEAWFAAEVGRPLAKAGEVPARVRRAVAETRRGRRRPLLDLRGLTDFERSVLLKTLEIPSGEVRSYAWVAREIGRPLAVRAVGNALAHNPIPLLIPCHRVVTSGGRLGMYSGGGPGKKREILAAEGLDAGRLEDLARRGTRFLGSRTTHVFCLPSCHSARRTQPRNEVAFRDERQARAAGYRPCANCRPALAS